MMNDAFTLKNQASQSSGQSHSMNVKILSWSEAVELLEVGVKMSSEFALLVSGVISKASERARLESLKPPPAVNYRSLRSEFHDILHSLDGLRPSQQYERVWRLSSELEELVNSARESVNKNCTRETLEEAFICLQKFASQILHTDSEIEKGLTGCDGGILDSISDAMVDVGTLLRDKGGPKDVEIKGKIELWARGEYGYECKFPEVLRIVWGPASAEEKYEGEKVEEDGQKDSMKEVTQGQKRSHPVAFGNDDDKTRRLSL